MSRSHLVRYVKIYTDISVLKTIIYSKGGTFLFKKNIFQHKLFFQTKSNVPQSEEKLVESKLISSHHAPDANNRTRTSSQSLYLYEHMKMLLKCLSCNVYEIN